MSTSGTWAFALDIAEIIEEAYERIGKELRSGYSYRTARKSLDLLLLEWQNRGYNLWTVKNASQALTASTATYALAAERLDIVEASLRTNEGDVSSQSDQHMRRIDASDYARLTNKLQTGKPTQFYVERAPTGITLYLWPVPDDSSYVLNYWYIERIEDSGKPGSNTVDVPARFLPALVSGLAYQLALKDPEVYPMLPTLQGEYENQFSLASESHRDKTSFFVKPWLRNV